MFDLPEAKRVRRSDLYTRSASSSPPPSSEPDLEIQAQFRARLAELYGDATLGSAPDATAGEQEGVLEVEPEEQEQEQAFEFRLFATSNADGDGVEAQKIVLHDDEGDTGQGGFVKIRDPRIFVAERAVGERKAGFERMAVSGEAVLDAACKRAWGLEVPWRIRTIRIVAKQKPGDGNGNGNGNGKGIVQAGKDDIAAKKKRPGKKRRVVLRGRKKMRDEMAEKRKKEKESKEEAEREKKTRRNREKKVKRRLKEKAMKSAGQGNTVAAYDDTNTTSPAAAED